MMSHQLERAGRRGSEQQDWLMVAHSDSYNASMKILFLHGWRSVPGGVKPAYLAEHGHEVVNPALPDEDFAAAIQIAQAEFDRHHPAVVVGSSRGGAVAMNIHRGEA